MFEQMLANCDFDDLEKLHDILTMMARAIDVQQKKIDRINAVFPSTFYGEIQEMYEEDPAEYPAKRMTSDGLR